MLVFVAVAEEQSFAGGARRLVMSPPAVTRAIAALEDRLGVKLLNRTTRHVRVTEAGQRYLDDARRIIAEVDEADEAAAGTNAEPRGHLAVTAPVMFGRVYVMPGIVEYMQRYPGMEVTATFVDRIANLLEEGLDVGIRIGELPDSSMQGIGVGHVRRVLCAAPSYLARHGTPQEPADLARHTILSASGVSTSAEWKFMHRGQSVAVRIRPRLVVNTNDGAIEAARAGLGIVRLMSYQVAPLLEAGELVKVLPDFEPASLPVSVVHREGRRGSARLRTFIDLMVERLRADRALNPQPATWIDGE
jgi:DNA-binding transcriptional LysR family regulator